MKTPLIMFLFMFLNSGCATTNSTPQIDMKRSFEKITSTEGEQTQKEHSYTKEQLDEMLRTTRYDLRNIQQIILEGGDRRHIVGRFGITDLHIALLMGEKEEVFNYITKDNIGLRDGRNATFLHYVPKENCLEFVEYLVEKGIDINAKNDNGESALFRFAGDYKVLKYLVEYGGDVKTRNRDGYSLLFRAVRSIDSVKYLVGLGLKVVDHVRTPVIYSNEQASVRAEKEDERIGKGLTPLHFAVRDGNIDVVKYLVENGADINDKGEYSNTPYSRAIDGGHIDIVRFALSRGADFNYVCELSGETALPGSNLRLRFDIHPPPKIGLAFPGPTDPSS
ncbi:MAG: hypothetical protein GY847_06150 [Proteobacteria bacterium]|nr:hypothetical protein [Pseudomonadota bacterium]